MDGKRFNPISNFMHKKCARRLHDRLDRISELPDEIIVVILSFLPLREAAATSVLSSRWLNLWKHTPNINFDSISQLPDPIIIVILSFLSLKKAATTCVLSTRWSNLWRHTPNLNFSNGILKTNSREYRRRGKLWDAESCKNIGFVNSLLQLHKAPSLKQFRIYFYVNKSAQLKVAKWLEFAFFRGVERLELDFKCYASEHKVDLEELLRDSGLCSSQTIMLFKSLKRLCLTCLRVSGEAIKILLRNCLLLEELIICSSVLTSDVEFCGATLMLKHLEVCFCSGEKSIKVYAPNLTFLRADDASENMLLENVPKLVEADFIFRSQSLDVMQNFASAVFCFSSQLKILNLTLLLPKVFLANEVPQMPNLTKLVVEYYGVKTESILPVTALVWASPRLQEFKLVFSEARPEAIEVMKNTEISPHRNLQVFEFAGFIGSVAHHIELVTYILDNCVALQKIIVGRSPFSPTLHRRRASEIMNEKQFARDYAKQQLQGMLPQHIQLQLL